MSTVLGTQKDTPISRPLAAIVVKSLCNGRMLPLWEGDATVIEKSSSISKDNFHSGGITPGSGLVASTICVLCAQAIPVFFAYHVLRLVHPDGPFSFPKHPACLSQPILSHHPPPPPLSVSGVRRTPTKLSTLGAALATPPLPTAWIRPLASQNTLFVVCPPTTIL